MKKQGFGFTLVELIVVITILAILGTIAFLSFQNHAKSSRDSARIADLYSIGKGLELFIVQYGRYPLPDNGVQINYSGALLWTQGIIGDDVIANTDILNKKPLDPSIGVEYTYSVINIQDEYQLGSILEIGDVSYNVTSSVYADSSYKALLRGNYNGKILKTATGGVDYVFALPSITATDTDDTSVEDILAKKKFVYQNYNNIPSSYNSVLSSGTGGFDYETSKLIIYTGSISDLSTASGQLDFAAALKESYSGTILAADKDFREEIAIDVENQEELSKNVVKNYLNNKYGGLSTGGTYDLASIPSTSGNTPSSDSKCTFGVSTFPCDL